MSKEIDYKNALIYILNYWASTQDFTTPPIQWAEEMAGIACDALIAGVKG